jgi:hypothetical protein
MAVRPARNYPRPPEASGSLLFDVVLAPMRHGGRDFCRTKLSREKASDESRRVMMKALNVATLEVRICTPHAGTEIMTDPAPREVPVTPERPRVIGLSAMCSAGLVAADRERTGGTWDGHRSPIARFHPGALQYRPMHTASDPPVH